MTGPAAPTGFRFEQLAKAHDRKSFSSGQAEVDDWLKSKAFQNQRKHLSATTVLVDDAARIAGYFTLSTSQVDFGDLPEPLTKKLPKRQLPVAVLSWLGVAREHQRRGFGRLLLARALTNCYEAGRTFPFVAVILDSVSDEATAFYQQFDFAELPNRPGRMYLAFGHLEEILLAE